MANYLKEENYEQCVFSITTDGYLPLAQML